MHILSWNVHGLTKDKKDDPHFTQIVTSSDLIFLYESWTDANSNVDLEGYCAHNFYRQFKHKNAKRASGGIVMYYKQHLKDGIQVVKNHFNTVIWIKLDKTFFHIDKDIYICSVYLWGEDSPAYNNTSVDLFDMIQNDVNYFQTVGIVYLTGDLNSRTGCRPDFIVNDHINTCLDDDDYIPDTPLSRTSADNTCNNYGVKLLDLCKSTGMRIMNGRVGHDTNAYTFISLQGASVIDYVITHDANFARVSQFTIDSINEWSDHTPVRFSLQCGVLKSRDDETGGVKVKWDSKYREKYRACLIGKLPGFNNIINNIDSSSRDGINRMTYDFTTLLCEITEPLFLKQIFKNNTGTFCEPNITKHADFFDKDCVKARNKYLDALENFNRSKCNPSREYLHVCKQEYKTVVKRKKHNCKIKKLLEIEKLKNSKPKEFWKHFKQKKQQQQDSSITLEQFRDFFAGLSNDLSRANNLAAESFCNNHDFNNATNSTNLDAPISVNEVQSAVKSLKSDKSAGSDNLLNEYFIEGIDI